MAKVDKLNQRSNKFSLVLNDSGADCFKNSNYIVTTVRCCDLLSIHFVACIKHDKDVDDETNHVKTLHYHLVISLYNNCRVSTMLNIIVDLFHCNENQVSIEKCNNLISSTRYLIHLDDFEKEPYNRTDIVCNDYSLLKDYLDYVDKIKDAKDLIAIVRQFPNLLELIARIGLDNYKRYRTTIHDIRLELNTRY